MRVRVARPEPERAPERAPTPPPPGTSNAALARAILLRDWRKYKDERTLQKLQNDKEKEVYGKLRDAGFAEEHISTAGPGKPNADLLAYDGDRLWIVEVKGHNDWLSEGNQSETGNVPLKQLGQKLLGSRKKRVKVSKVSVTVGDFLAAPNEAGRDAITLMVTNLDTEGALLAVQTITGAKGEQTASYYATTLHQVMRFIRDTMDGDFDANDDSAEIVDEQSAAAQALLDDWDEWEGTAEVFLSNNAVAIETVYTRFRQATRHKQPHTTFAKLDAALNVNVALIPVRNAARVARRAVLARTKFKTVQEAGAWFERTGKTKPREQDEDDDSWITRLLAEDAEYGGNDFGTNYDLINQALAAVDQPPVQPPQRQAPKGKKHRTLDGKIWNHIVNGVIVEEKSGSKKTQRDAGLHTIRGDAPVGEGHGPQTFVGDLGCYRQTVRVRRGDATGPTAEDKDKKLQSTFFPDDWTLEEIREAIEYAAPPRNNAYEVLTPAKGIGMTLWFNGESYYPNYR